MGINIYNLNEHLVGFDVIFDWLYAGLVARQKMTRRKADELFLEAMRCSQVPAYTALPMYYAVRLFGGAYVD